MSSSEEEIPPPWTEISTDFNFSPRVVECTNCKYTTICALPDPRCGICNRKMITIPKRIEVQK